MPLSVQEKKVLQEVSETVSAPVLLNYVSWILRTAQARNIHTLYFLARDGYILHKIATKVVEQEKLPISCRYLYCSRISLRTPTYHFIGEEAFDLLLLGGYNVTPRSILHRVTPSDDWCEQILISENILEADWDIPLSRRAFECFAQKLRKNEAYRAKVMEISQYTYEPAVGYLKQEGLLNEDTVAIVDSGWTGSMQRSLRQLLEAMGYSGKLVGFYFGMYAPQKVEADGEYLTWYFDYTGKTIDKILFCNNLFECILSAPHGMTMGYQKRDIYEPILAMDQSVSQIELVRAQEDAITRTAENLIQQFSLSQFERSAALQDTRERLHRFMASPTQDEVAVYGGFHFSDDIQSGGLSPLASPEQVSQLKGYSILSRALRRIRPKTSSYTEMFWPYGTLAYLSGLKALWYKWNIYAWEWIKHEKNRSTVSRVQRCYEDDYKRLIDEHDIISFDIFDTLLYRTVGHPTDVFTLMEPVVRGFCPIPLFHEARIEAEQEARRLSTSEDITLFDIYTLLDVSTDISKCLMDCEKDIECSVLRRDVMMADLLEYAVHHQKKVLVISDMYQTSDFLNTVLQRAGIYGYTNLYVSSEAGVTKASGNLFRLVAKDEHIQSLNSWLHIGDNPHSDFEVPKRLGLDAALYYNGRSPSPTHRNGLLSQIIRVLGRLRRTSKEAD